jgi:hypothetical protein
MCVDQPQSLQKGGGGVGGVGNREKRITENEEDVGWS